MEVVHLASTNQIHANDKLQTSHNQYTALSEAELLNKLEKSRKHAAQRNFQDADEMTRELKVKYGL